MALHLASQEPVIVEDAVFVIERNLGVSGEVRVRAGEYVEPATIIAAATGPAGRVMTLHLAREIGVSANTLARYLTKQIGSSFEAGEAVARARRGLRVAVATAPAAGTLTEVDESTGTGVLAPATTSYELRALIHGVVVTVLDGRGAILKSGGARVRGAFGVGGSVVGPLKVAIDRPDREFTLDAVSPDLKGTVVLGGMTVSAATLRKLAEVGATGVVVGSISEADVRRVIPGGEENPAAFWRSELNGPALAAGLDRAPLTVLVTEGFGRRPMTAPIFQFLSKREGQSASIMMPSPQDSRTVAPELYFSAPAANGPETIERISPGTGVVARLVDPEHLGTVVTCRSEAVYRRWDGQTREMVDVELANGSRRWVPAANLEILTYGR